jgi:hypothetical protein
MDFLNYYYYRVFKYFSDGSSIPMYRTFILFFVFAYLNFLSILNIISLVWPKRISMPEGEGISWLWPLMIVIPLFVIFYIYLKNNGVHEDIMRRFEEETQNKKRARGFLIILYFLLSIAFFVGSLWLRNEIKKY